MAPRIRIFIVNDDDTVDDLPVWQYEKLLRRDPDFAILRYAGRKIRYVSVVVESAEQTPPKVINAQYSYLTFDSNGHLDVDERGLKANLALGMLPPLYRDPDDQMVDARQRFVRKRYQDQYKWQPTPDILAEIRKMLFDA